MSLSLKGPGVVDGEQLTVGITMRRLGQYKTAWPATMTTLLQAGSITSTDQVCHVVEGVNTINCTRMHLRSVSFYSFLVFYVATSKPNLNEYSQQLFGVSVRWFFSCFLCGTNVFRVALLTHTHSHFLFGRFGGFGLDAPFHV